VLKIKPIRTVLKKTEFARIVLVALLFAFLVLYLFVSNKIIWILYLLFLALIIFARMKLTLNPPAILVLLFLPLLWGLIMSYNTDSYHFFQGFFYLSIPLILIIVGFQLSYIFTVDKYFYSIVIIGNLIALLFIVITIIKAGFSSFLSPYTEARFVVASGSPACILSLVIAAYSEQFNLKIFKTSWGRYLTIILSLTAIYLFAGRTYWVMLFVYVAIFSIKTMRKDKLIFYGFLFIGVILLLSLIINSKTGLTFQNSLLYKLLNSFTEIKVSNFSDYGDINIYYRGYEAYRSWITFTEGNLVEKLFGGGYGQMVNLGTEVWLDGRYWSAVPIVHNGFFFILVKEGALGLILILLFFWNLFRKGVKSFNSPNPQGQFMSVFLLSSAASMFLTNFVVRGLFSHEMAVVTITIGFLVSCLTSSKHESSSDKSKKY